MLLRDLNTGEKAVIKKVELGDEKAVKRLADLGVFAGESIVLEGGSKRKKFFVISAGGKKAGVSLDVASAIIVEKAGRYEF